MCDQPDCNSPPEFRPVLVMRYDRSNAVSRAVLSLRVCLVCKSRLKLDIISDEQWQQLVAEYIRDKKPPPVREYSYLDFCGIKSKVAKRADAQEAKITLHDPADQT